MKALTLKQFLTQFPDDAACLEHMMRVRYGDRFDCPKCGKNAHYYRIKKRRAYGCEYCGHQVYPTVGTPFEATRTSLRDWFHVMFLFCTTRNGVAAKEVQRQLGVTYKTAWRMCDKIRQYMAYVDGDGTLDGHVELDEAFIGGKRKGGKKQGITGRGSKKAIVFGLAERDGEVITRVIDHASRKEMFPIITKHVAKGSHISTDEWPAYFTIPSLGYTHGKVEHKSKEYVRGVDHVNTLEAFWAMVKRTISGTHVWVSKKHLPKYLAEIEYRWNLRKQPHLMFDLLLCAFAAPAALSASPKADDQSAV